MLHFLTAEGTAAEEYKRKRIAQGTMNYPAFDLADAANRLAYDLLRRERIMSTLSRVQDIFIERLGLKPETAARIVAKIPHRLLDDLLDDVTYADEIDRANNVELERQSVELHEQSLKDRFLQDPAFWKGTVTGRYSSEKSNFIDIEQGGKISATSAPR
jgi:hypothetical protein